MATIRGRAIQVDTLHEILVNKLCILLSRTEIRDLYDVRGIVAAGSDLDRVVADAPAKDGGFSAGVLAWVMERFPVEAAAQRAAFPAGEVPALSRFRDELVGRLVVLTRPER